MKYYERPIKPKCVDAVQVTMSWFDGDHPNPLHPVGFVIDPVRRVVECNKAGRPIVQSMHGETELVVGDWIVTAANGRRFRVKDDLFREMMEPIEDAPVSVAERDYEARIDVLKPLLLGYRSKESFVMEFYVVGERPLIFQLGLAHGSNPHTGPFMATHETLPAVLRREARRMMKAAADEKHASDEIADLPTIHVEPR